MSHKFDNLVSKKFNNASADTMKYTSKMCNTYLKLYNLPIPPKINDKRKAVLEYKEECLHSKSIKSNNLKIEYLVRTSYTLRAQLKTSNEDNIENLYIYYKQYLHELHSLDQKLKTISNEKDKKPIWQMQYNNVNLPLLIENLKRTGRTSYMHDRKEFTEKEI